MKRKVYIYNNSEDSTTIHTVTTYENGDRIIDVIHDVEYNGLFARMMGSLVGETEAVGTWIFSGRYGDDMFSADHRAKNPDVKQMASRMVIA